jgi:hypothetical protein
VSCLLLLISHRHDGLPHHGPRNQWCYGL